MSVATSKKNETISRKVILCGTTDIMFDRYAGDNQTKLEPWQKMYLAPGDLKVIGLPAANIMSALSAQNTTSWPKRFLPSKEYKSFCNACLSFVSISPSFIPFMRDGRKILFDKLEGDVDKVSGVYIHRSVARLEKGIPNPKERPALPLDWSLEFTLTMYANQEVQEQQLLNIFEKGGMAMGLGTYRGVFGKFEISEWK